MSVLLVRREGLATSHLPEDYVSMSVQAQLGQEDFVLPLRQNENGESASEESESTDSSSISENLNPPAEVLLNQRKDFGLLKHGCPHYRRRCRLRAPCCGEVFDCRHCHNEAKNVNEGDPRKRHDLPRHLVESVICSICSTEQEVQQVCKSCGVCMGEYFCGMCKFFDDETKKGQYHCDACGICRVGGRDKFFHCHRCGCCYSTDLQNGHPCVEKSMHHNCPVCFEYLFDSMKDIRVMPCGHTMHFECLAEMQKHSQFSCPMCSKSVCDMSEVWKQLDQEVAATPMPKAYENKMVWILCNDCGKSSEVPFHIIAHKCNNCSSYNTRQTKSGPSASRP